MWQGRFSAPPQRRTPRHFAMADCARAYPPLLAVTAATSVRTEHYFHCFHADRGAWLPLPSARQGRPVQVGEETTVDESAPTAHGIDPLERETIRRVTWRLMPLVMLGYFCAFLDRSNVGMAATTMNQQLGFSNAVFGFGAGVFFISYALAEIPSNLILNMVGARRWLARIMLTWGIVAGLTAFVWNDWSFYSIRVLLGLAEAGFFPGVILYLTWWFPSAYRSRMVAVFCSAVVISLFRSEERRVG